MFELTTVTPPKHSVWDNYVPIVRKGASVYVHMHSEIESPDYYTELCHELTYADDHETFYLKLNTPGGVVDSALMIREAMSRSKARIIAEPTGTVASAGTIITLGADDIILPNYLSFMIHNYSGSIRGKGHEMKAYQDFTDRELGKVMRDIYGGYLTDAEITAVIDGKDIWHNATEVRTRWDAMKNAPEKTPKG